MISEFITEIQKEEWYKLSNGNIFTTRDGVEINLTYREISCVIDVIPNARTVQSCFRCVSPNYCCTAKARRTNSITRAVKIVCEIFAESIKAIEVEIEKLLAQEEAKRLKEEQRKNVIQKFKLPVVQHEYQLERLTFQMSKNFCLNFDYNGTPGNETFYIGSITGGFSSNQIEKFMNCLSECPEAAADRLINGK